MSKAAKSLAKGMNVILSPKLAQPRHAKLDDTIALRREVHALLILSFDRDSKFYTQDCDELWRRLASRSRAELKETMQRQQAIARVSAQDLARHCQL